MQRYVLMIETVDLKILALKRIRKTNAEFYIGTFSEFEAKIPFNLNETPSKIEGPSKIERVGVRWVFSTTTDLKKHL